MINYTTFIFALWAAYSSLFAILDLWKDKYSFSFLGASFLKEKQLISPKGNKIILLGMSHIADDYFYQTIKKAQYELNLQ